MQLKSHINIFSIVLMAMFCSLNADRSSVLYYREVEENKIVPDILISAEDLRIDLPPYDGDRTAEFVKWQDNDQEGFRVDLTSYSNDNYSNTSSASYEKPDTCSNYYDSSQNDVTRYNDAESNFRDMPGNKNDYQDIDYVPDYNTKPINLIKIKEPGTLEEIQLLSPVKWPDAITIDEEFYLWEQELECWKGDGLQEAQNRKARRIAAYQNCKDNPLGLKKYCYELTSNAKTYLHKNQINATIFQKGCYNAMQHQLHTEFVEIVEELTCFDKNVRYPHEFKLVNADLVHIAANGVQHNKIGDVIKAATIADFAWKVLECGKAVLKGGYEGAKNAGSYALQNPHEVLLYGIAPELMGGYYTLKLIHSVGSLVIDIAQVGVTKSCKEALKNTNLCAVLHGTAACIAQVFFNKLLNDQSVCFVGKSQESLVAVVAGECPVTYAAFKDVRKARARRSSDAIKNVKNKLFKDAQLMRNKSVPQGNASLSPDDAQIYKQFIKESSLKINPKNNNGLLCFKHILSSDPNDLSRLGWVDVTNLAALARSNTRTFYHSAYDLYINFDKGQQNLPGFRGIDHYHIRYPFSKSKFDYYLDLHGNLMKKGSADSHIVLESLKDACSCKG